MAHGLTIARRPKEALAAARRALDLDPNSAHGHNVLGFALACDGKGAEAIEAIERVMRISPRDPIKAGYYISAGFANVVAGRYPEAAEWARRALAELPDLPNGHFLLAASAAQAGLLDEARAAMAAARRLQPRISLARVERSVPLAHAADRARYIEGLRLAGLE